MHMTFWRYWPVSQLQPLSIPGVHNAHSRNEQIPRPNICANPCQTLPTSIIPGYTAGTHFGKSEANNTSMKKKTTINAFTTENPSFSYIFEVNIWRDVGALKRGWSGADPKPPELPQVLKEHEVHRRKENLESCSARRYCCTTLPAPR